ncbi:hypothetical protein CEXT_182431 [Caerostris extrusa]|uniref:Uncharacterized protein n=1 Tax=Caerostris extrusa TaxID=172846 RepID=A0AAV4MCE5_CAEEX|nr:hypothetical protein CEXT_182431 [Caerostris extrusa]
MQLSILYETSINRLGLIMPVLAPCTPPFEKKFLEIIRMHQCDDQEEYKTELPHLFITPVVTLVRGISARTCSPLPEWPQR